LVLSTRKPREQKGRDTFARYKAQIRSAAIASLAILEGEIDRVYCDLHDDFVIRYNKNGAYQYSFYQVKTKNKVNSSWSINDLFGIKTTGKKPPDIQKMKDSFGGKMFLHTVNFPDNCNEIIFQTNITLKDDTEKFIDDIITGNFSEKHPKILFDKFQEVAGDSKRPLSNDDIKACLSKFRVSADVQYLKDKEHRFDSYAVDSIYKYSEIELSRTEREIILLKLVDLVSEKSCGIITDYSMDTIESESAISIDDLLRVLSISKPAYTLLKSSGDERAIKHASLIQRALNDSGADAEQLIFCTKCKVDWNVWWSRNRHFLPEPKLFSLRNRVRKVIRKVVRLDSVDFEDMLTSLETLKDDLELSGLLFDLTMNELIGAFFSELSKEL